MTKKYVPVVNHQWTKDEIKKLVRIWDSMTLGEVAEEMGLEKTQVQYMANEVRKLYPKFLAKKHRRGVIMGLIKEALG